MELPEIFKKKIKVSFLDELQEAFLNLNLKERFLFWFFSGLLILSTFSILFILNKKITVEVPREGGEIIEGVIGLPRFINPILAISDTDRDLSNLIYSGLTKATPEGILVNDLAENFNISPGGLEYIFTIKEDIRFHDGKKVTADDIVFTISLAKNDLLKSPRRASWDGIQVEKLDAKTVVFRLKEPYSPFLENTTIGILPKHIWQNLKPEEITFSDFNLKPVGSGPYKINSIKKNSAGIPEEIELKAFKAYALGKPFIQKVKVRFYDNEENLMKAFNKKDIDNTHTIAPEKAKELLEKGRNVITTPLPRVFGLFFNQNQATIFANTEVRKALDISVPKERIISEVLKDFGTNISGPLPPGIIIRGRETQEEKGVSNMERVSEAIEVLEKGGWQKGDDGVMIKRTKKETERLSFSISTSNAPELKALALILKEEWQEIGAEIELKFFEIGILNQEVIRPRKYDSLLFGEIIGRDFDLFAFWHSSQRNDPGLNIALYTNITADKLLEEIRTTSVRRQKENAYIKFEKEIAKDIPAIFLYSPDFILASNKNIRDMRIGVITTPAERFLNIQEWHLKTDRVWPFFVKN